MESADGKPIVRRRGAPSLGRHDGIPHYDKVPPTNVDGIAMGKTNKGQTCGTRIDAL